MKNEVTLQGLTEGLTDLKKPADICRSESETRSHLVYARGERERWSQVGYSAEMIEMREAKERGTEERERWRDGIRVRAKEKVENVV